MENLSLRLAALAITSSCLLYRPLNVEQREIRLLTLKPLSQTSMGRVECALEYVSLSSPPNYECVSYCWGNASNRASILLNGWILDVPASAEIVLSQLRYDDRERTVWLDAVCINQQDKKERGHQVALMGDIYRQCTRNLIYLGSDDGTAEDALCNIDTIVSELKHDTQDFRQLHSTLFDEASSKENVCFSIVPLRASLRVEALINLYSRPWFSRLWVFQEAVLAPESSCICGSFTMDLLAVLRVAVWLSHKRFMIPREFLLCNGLLNAAKMWELVDRDWGVYDIRSGKSPNLASLLSFTTDLGATEPRDRIYGLIGMIRRQNQHGILPELLTPDYNRPLACIYRDAIRFSLQELESFYPLRSISHRCVGDLALEGFPSWVPRYDREWNEKEDPAELADIYHASHGLPILLSDVGDPDVLQVDGIFCASALRTSEIFKARRGWADATDLLAQVECMTSCPSNDAGDKTYYDTIAATLIAGCNMQLMPADKEDVEAFKYFCQYLTQHTSVPFEPHEIDKDSDDITRAATLYWHNLRQACLDRRVFTTSDGRLGVGPKSMRQGDIVAVLYGGITPYILRPVKGYYQFLGDAYVHGIMNGESVIQHQISGAEDCKFSIR